MFWGRAKPRVEIESAKEEEQEEEQPNTLGLHEPIDIYKLIRDKERRTIKPSQR